MRSKAGYKRLRQQPAWLPQLPLLLWPLLSLCLCFCFGLSLGKCLLSGRDLVRGEYSAYRRIQMEESTATGCSNAAALTEAMVPTASAAATSLAACFRREIDICVTLLNRRENPRMPRHRLVTDLFSSCYYFVFDLFPICNLSYCKSSDLSNGFHKFCAIYIRTFFLKRKVCTVI